MALEYRVSSVEMAVVLQMARKLCVAPFLKERMASVQ